MLTKCSKYVVLAILLSLLFHRYAKAVDYPAKDSAWGPQLYQYVIRHPEVVAVQEKMNSQLSSADALEKPLYNPEMEAEIEREGDTDTKRVGMTQTVDWWNKRETRKNQAKFSREAAQSGYQDAIHHRMAETLLALVKWQTAQKKKSIALEQEKQLDTLLKFIEQRQQAGDLGQIDAELAYLSLSQRLSESAEAEAELAETNAALNELLTDVPRHLSGIPDDFWQQTMDRDIEHLIDRNPRVVQALAEWQVSKEEAEFLRREAKADPTFGVNGGKVGEENVIALTLSIPLHFRNNYHAETRAAHQDALAAEASYMSIRRQQRYRLEGSQAVLNAYQSRYQRWRSIMEARIARSAQLLERQLQTGDLSTSAYLLALKERSEGLQAGIALEYEWHKAVIEWLEQTGNLVHIVQRY